nr:hypothetical protein 1 [bacterium]
MTTVYNYSLSGGINRTKEFEKKGLATHAVNVGLVCGHGCTYCSSPSLLRQHQGFRDLQLNPFTDTNYAIVDPDTPTRVARRVPRLKETDTVMVCTTTDAWAPECLELDLGRRVTQWLLENTKAQVRILTKSAKVRKDYDLFSQYPTRITLGISTGLPKSLSHLATVLEPHASSIEERFDALQFADDMGIRTYGMLCPIPPVADNLQPIVDELIDEILDCDPEHIWTENMNARGNCLIKTEKALEDSGHTAADVAQRIHNIRRRANWSTYTRHLIECVQSTARRHDIIDGVSYLLYPKGLSDEDRAAVEADSEGVILLS